MLIVSPELLNLTTEERGIYNNFCYRFYHTFLYSKEDYEAFIQYFEILLSKYDNDKDKYSKIIFDLVDFFNDKCDIENRLTNVPIVLTLIKNIVDCYKQNDKFFINSYIGGKRNFLYYLDLHCLKRNTTSKEELTKIKEEILKTEKEMKNFKANVINGPEMQ